MKRIYPMTLLSVTGAPVCRIEHFRETRFAPHPETSQESAPVATQDGAVRELLQLPGISAGLQSRLTNTISKLQVSLEWRPNIPMEGGSPFMSN
jgi:hypothetical protein